MTWWLRASATAALALFSATALATQPCVQEGAVAGYLPAEGVRGISGGSAAIICGLPASQNPILGVGEEHTRKRAIQSNVWIKSLEQGRMPASVKKNDPLQPGVLTTRETKE